VGMRILALIAFAVSIAAISPVIMETPARAQAKTDCGPVSYSNADQKYVGVPCTPTTPQADASKTAPCGPVAYSNADQKYTGVPCAPPTPQTDASKSAPCGPVAYSNADQKYTGVPCTH